MVTNSTAGEHEDHHGARAATAPARADAPSFNRVLTGAPALWGMALTTLAVRVSHAHPSSPPSGEARVQAVRAQAARDRHRLRDLDHAHRVRALLVLLGIVWIAVYVNVAKDAATYVAGLGKKPSNPLPWMADLGKWNYLIGFGLIFFGLVVSANKKTPLGRGRGVVVGMLGCFLFGLVWIVPVYFTGNDSPIPVMKDLGQYNLMVGIGFMAVGFAYATKWE